MRTSRLGEFLHGGGRRVASDHDLVDLVEPGEGHEGRPAQRRLLDQGQDPRPGGDLGLRHGGGGRGRLAEPALDADAGRADHADVGVHPVQLGQRPVALLGAGPRADRPADVVDRQPRDPGEHEPDVERVRDDGQVVVGRRVDDDLGQLQAQPAGAQQQRPVWGSSAHSASSSPRSSDTAGPPVTTPDTRDSTSPLERRHHRQVVVRALTITGQLQGQPPGPSSRCPRAELRPQRLEQCAVLGRDRPRPGRQTRPGTPGSGSTASTAPPWTRTSWALDSSTRRSRRTVSCATPSRAAASPTSIRPSAASQPSRRSKRWLGRQHGGRAVGRSSGGHDGRLLEPRRGGRADDVPGAPREHERTPGGGARSVPDGCPDRLPCARSDGLRRSIDGSAGPRAGRGAGPARMAPRRAEDEEVTALTRYPPERQRAITDFLLGQEDRRATVTADQRAPRGDDRDGPPRPRHPRAARAAAADPRRRPAARRGALRGRPRRAARRAAGRQAAHRRPADRRAARGRGARARLRVADALHRAGDPAARRPDRRHEQPARRPAPRRLPGRPASSRCRAWSAG